MPTNPISAVPVATARYYPRLSEVITVDDLPEFLSFVENGLNSIFDNIHYKNLQYSKGHRGDSAFYSLDIVSSKRLELSLPFDLKLVLNPDLKDGDSAISSFPITLEYQWEILAFIKTFSSASFSFSIEDFYKVGLDVFRISEEQVLAQMLNVFVEAQEGVTKYEQLLADINDLQQITAGPTYQELAFPEGAEQSIDSVITLINNNPGINESISLLLFAVYILRSDIDETKSRLQEFYNIIVPDGIEAHIKRIITPKAKATLALSAGIEFPQNILRPVESNGSDYVNPTTGLADPTAKSMFVFAQAQLYADTEAGIGYQLEMGGSLMPSNFAMIGKSGLILQLDTLKIDLSKKSNIPEADADGRPDDFVGVYARAISVTLPSKWFHDDNDAPEDTVSTLRIGAYDLLVGTGGLSGNILLETVPVVPVGTSSSFNYFDDKFDFIYPITMFEKNNSSSVVEEKEIANYTDLIGYLQQLNAAQLPYSFQYPLTLVTKDTISSSGISASTIYTFDSAQEYQLFLSQLIENTLWKRIGSTEKGFRVGFNKFDIAFKQNKVVNSSIKGVLEIPKFKKKDGNGELLQIGIDGHLYEDGDFNLTASFAKGSELEASLFNVVDFKFNSIELGKEEDDFYIGTACEISFTNGIMQKLLKDQKIIIEKLRIYSDGNIELVGGDIPLPVSISLDLGPVKMAVSNVHFGATQINGRKYNFWGFDGAISINPLGLDARGEGVKYYYCTDDGYEDSFLRIQTIEVDLMIPGSATADNALAIIHGMLSLPEPGVDQEFTGEVSLKLPKFNISGSVGMRFAPKYPAFLIDASIDLATPIPLGAISISAFRGLLGFRYVATKEAAGLTSDNTWYDYYMKPKKGININKFSGPPASLEYKDPFAIGAGATFGTSADNGHVLSMRAMVLLSLPTLFYIEAGLNIISKKLGLAEDDPSNPPFFAFVAIGDHSLELGAGADFSIPKDSGSIFKLHAKLEAGFFFKNQKPWYVNLGTQKDPIAARVLTLFNAKSFIMLSAQGIQAGARLDYDLKKSFGPAKVHLWAYIELGGHISFKRPQFGAYMMAGGGIKIKIWIVKVEVSLNTVFSVEAVKPFLIYAELSLKVRVKIGFIKVRKTFKIQLQWEFNKTIDYTPYSPIPKGTLGDRQENSTQDLVKGVHMLTNESFALNYFNSVPTVSAITNVIPLDTFIDIKTNKGLLPRNNTLQRIGGFTSGATNYTLMMPPVAVVKGKKLRQVTHRFSITNIEIKAWTASGWVDYNPYEAVVSQADRDEVNGLPWAQWQKALDQYDSIRVLGTTPFSFLGASEPGWYIPEQYGITPSKLFCQDQEVDEKFITFLNKNIGQQYAVPEQYEADEINGIFFKLIGETSLLDEGNVIAGDFMSITGETNLFGLNRSLAFNNYNQLEIIFPEPVAQVSLCLTTHANSVKIQAFTSEIKAKQLEVPGEENYEFDVERDVSFTQIFDAVYTKNQLTTAIQLSAVANGASIEEKFESPKIDKILITPIGTNTARILEIREEIAALFVATYETAIDENQGSVTISEPSDVVQYEALMAELATLKSNGGDCYPVSNPLAQPSFTHYYGYSKKENYVFENVIQFGDSFVISFHPTAETTVLIQTDTKGKLLRERLLPGVVTSMQLIAEQLVVTLASLADGCKGIGEAIIAEDFVIGCQGEVSTTTIVKLDSELNLIEATQYLDSYSLDYNHLIAIANGELLWINVISNETHIHWVATNGQIIQSFQIPEEAIKVLQNSATEFTLITKDKKVIPFTIDTLAKTVSLGTANRVLDTAVTEFTDAILVDDKIVVTVALQDGNYGVVQIDNGIVTLVTDVTVFDSKLQLSNEVLADNKIIVYNEDYLMVLDNNLQLSQLIERKNGVEEATILKIQNIIANNEIFMISVKPNEKGVYFSLFGDQFDNCSLQSGTTTTLTSATATLENYAVTAVTISVPVASAYTKKVRYSKLITIDDTICAKGLVYEEEEDDFDCTTSVQKVGWLSKEDYIYNAIIPGVEAVQEEINKMKDAVQEVVQPIWRPNTTYYLHFTLEDAVETRTPTPFNYYYGFKTEGPVGHYQPPLKLGEIANPESNELLDLSKSPLTSLRSYIDYNRSYPNADGSLLQAKPVYYGNEQCKISIFFTQPYVYHMLKKWEEYGTLQEIKGALNITIKDPLNDVFIPFPLPTETVEYPIPVIEEGVESWVDDNDPRIPIGIKTLNNYMKLGSSCNMTLGDPIKPLSKFYKTTLTNLKPSKLYTVLVNNYFDANEDGIEALNGSENRLVHQFGFQTSRYENFENQVNSYLIEETDAEGVVIESREALFDVNLNLSSTQIDALYAVVNGDSNEISDAIATAYQDLFDRALNGVLKMPSLEPAQNTEFNRIVDSNTGNVVAILIRNPEPFNIPKIPLEEIQNTIQVGTVSLEMVEGVEQEVFHEDTQYQVLHSKDYAQVLIMNSSKNISAETLNFKFDYRMWNNNGEIVEGVVPLTILEQQVIVKDININN